MLAEPEAFRWLTAEAAQLIVAGRVSVLGAAFFHATTTRAPINLTEAIRLLVGLGLTEEEVRAGCAEALLTKVVHTDGHSFRPGDAAFFWPTRRASD